MVYAYDKQQSLRYWLKVKTSSPKTDDALINRQVTVQVDHSGVDFDFDFGTQKALVSILSSALDTATTMEDENSDSKAISNGAISNHRGVIKTLFMEAVAVDGGLMRGY